MKTLALAFVSFLAGYGAASLGMEIVSQRTALELRDALEEMDEAKPEPYGGQNLTSVSGVPVTVSWGTLYERDE